MAVKGLGVKRGCRRAGECVTHHDLAWLYDDGSVTCMHALIVETSSSGCEWRRMPTVWLQEGQEHGLTPGRAGKSEV